MFGVQNVSDATPTLLATRASVPMAEPMARMSVVLNEHIVVMPAGKEVGHLCTVRPLPCGYRGSGTW